MTTVDIPETPREQRGYWRGFAAIDTMDEIERRVRNLFGDPLRGWVLIDWYESQSTTSSPSIKNGLFLEDGFKPAILWLAIAAQTSVTWLRWATLSDEHDT